MTDLIKQRLESDVKDALKQGRKQDLGALRLFLSAFKQYEVDNRESVSDETAIALLTRLAKQRRESIAQFDAAGRDDLVAQEQFELDLLESYLPAALGDAEIEAEIRAAMTETAATSMKDMGKVMAALKPRLQGRADMAAVSSKIKAALSG